MPKRAKPELKIDDAPEAPADAEAEAEAEPPTLESLGVKVVQYFFRRKKVWIRIYACSEYPPLFLETDRRSPGHPPSEAEGAEWDAKALAHFTEVAHATT